MKTTLARSMLSVYLGQESIRFASSKRVVYGTQIPILSMCLIREKKKKIFEWKFFVCIIK